MKRTTKVGLGLLAAWAIHDLEEVWTMSATSKAISGKLPKNAPIPAGLRRAGMSQKHVRIGIGFMALVMSTAAVLGVRSEGRAPFFRAALLAFGIHGFGHLALTAAFRQYTSGLATAPTIVIPFWLWARKELAKEGLTDLNWTTALIALSCLSLLPAVHALLYKILKE